MLAGFVKRRVEEVIAKDHQSINERDLSPDKPPDQVMTDTRLFIKGAHINTLITVDMVHSFIRSGAVHIPEAKAFLSVKGPFH